MSQLKKRCECGLSLKGHPCCEACGAPICFKHKKDTTLLLFREHWICPDCRSYWLRKEREQKQETSWDEFTTGNVKKVLSPTYIDKRGRTRSRQPIISQHLKAKKAVIVGR